MISLEDLINAKLENEQKIADLNAENRVFDKLIEIERSKDVQDAQFGDEVIGEVAQQDETI